MLFLLFYELNIMCWNVGDHKHLVAAMLQWQWLTASLFLHTIRPQPQQQYHKEITKIYNHQVCGFSKGCVVVTCHEDSPHCSRLSATADRQSPHVLMQLHPSVVGCGCLVCFFVNEAVTVSNQTVQSLSMVSMVICPPKGCTEDPTGSGKLVGPVYIILTVAMVLPPPKAF